MKLLKNILNQRNRGVKILKIEIEGLDKIKKNLEDLKKNVEETDGERVRLDELLNSDFMQENTEFSDFVEMIEMSEFNDEDFEEVIETEEWNDYVTDTTKFKDWEEMLNTAAAEKVSKKLGFN